MASDFKSLLLIISIFISAVIETDIYLPAFADMMVYFSQSEESIQRLLTVNFVALCAVGPIYGVASDTLGRRRPLMIALLLFLVGSIITTIADNFNLMLIGRLLQGLGSGGCFTLGTAIIFDLFRKEAAIAALNKINVIVPFIMAAAPMFGGFLNLKFGFRSNFLAIALCVAFCFILCTLFFQETLPPSKRNSFHWHAVRQNFMSVLTSLPFLKLTLVVSLLFAGFLTFLSSIAVLYVVDFGTPKELFPYYQSALLVMYLIASLSCSAVIKRFGAQRVKLAGLAAVLLSATSLLAATIFAPSSAELLTVSMIPYSLGFIWLQTPYVTELMEILPNIKGISASVLTSLRLMITAAIISLVAFSYDATIVPTTAAIVVSSVLIAFIVLGHERLDSGKSKVISGKYRN